MVHPYSGAKLYETHEKTRVFTHRLTHALMGEHCPSKYKFPNEWMFEDSCIYENVVAIGQPTGYITLIDMNSQKMILELPVFEQEIQAMRRRERFRWVSKSMLQPEPLIG